MNDKLNVIFSEILDLEDSEISDDLTPDTADYWDSMNHLRLVTAVEQEFGINLTMDEVQSIGSIGAFREIVKNHLGEA